MHGTTMIFLGVMPLSAAFFNFLVPLQIGARDVAFPASTRSRSGPSSSAPSSSTPAGLRVSATSPAGSIGFARHQP
jgi:hypothetical protein